MAVRPSPGAIPPRSSNEQRESPSSRLDTMNSPTPIRTQAPHSRAPSSTVDPSQAAEVRKALTSPRRESIDKARVAADYEPRTLGSPLASPPLNEESPGPLSPSTSESDSDSDGPNLPFKRFGKFSMLRPRNTELDEDEEDEESPAFLPVDQASQRATHTTEHDPGATLREELGGGHSRRVALQKEVTTTSISTTSSGMGSASSASDGQQRRHHLGALSPRRAAELRLSPHNQAKRSDGTPSMGSSFSDLDDASVTQSALEEALLSNMQNGGVASRMSTLSQALRSRYL
ncbi:predicted protein [Uncinocarpus reesii 1704]|uniref:Uncharacterized protein n=1 Tax=Uncinocarpus reesii (strain UAMH 1704) TaxID=336963 RepID=C4JL66_UNCRE|nr:uncharacterized protein UREG_00401 [Uncinocarpus reesii 1704]EEP75555.1 predicted protein [Uncinocarpus reesii 1704]